jgi:hypothetical protein
VRIEKLTDEEEHEANREAAYKQSLKEQNEEGTKRTWLKPPTKSKESDELLKDQWANESVEDLPNKMVPQHKSFKINPDSTLGLNLP